MNPVVLKSVGDDLESLLLSVLVDFCYVAIWSLWTWPSFWLLSNWVMVSTVVPKLLFMLPATQQHEAQTRDGETVFH